MRIATAMALCLFGVTGVTAAGEVTVKGVHLCCPACVAGVEEALGGVAGVSDVSADRDAKLVTFKAEDDDAADAGVKALAEGGFFGRAKHGEKTIEFPKSGAKEGAKGDEIRLEGLHLCCGACVKGAQAALEDLDGAESIDIDSKKGTVVIRGKDVKLTGAISALNDAGFYAKPPKKSEK